MVNGEQKSWRWRRVSVVLVPDDGALPGGRVVLLVAVADDAEHPRRLS